MVCRQEYKGDHMWQLACSFNSAFLTVLFLTLSLWAFNLEFIFIVPKFCLQKIKYQYPSEIFWYRSVFCGFVLVSHPAHEFWDEKVKYVFRLSPFPSPMVASGMRSVGIILYMGCMLRPEELRFFKKCMSDRGSVELSEKHYPLYMGYSFPCSDMVKRKVKVLKQILTS